MRRGCHDSRASAAAAGGNMAMKALRGMVNGAMSELSSAVSGSRPAAAAPSSAAAREHVMAVKRDYISQPRLSESESRTSAAGSVEIKPESMDSVTSFIFNTEKNHKNTFSVELKTDLYKLKYNININ